MQKRLSIKLRKLCKIIKINFSKILQKQKIKNNLDFLEKKFSYIYCKIKIKKLFSLQISYDI